MKYRILLPSFKRQKKLSTDIVFMQKAEEVVMRTPDYDKLLEYGLDQRVAEKLDEIYKV
jgi:hypothetical protein